MATVYGVNATKVLTPTAANRVDSGEMTGRLRIMYDSYEGAAADIGTVIYIGDLLPLGARVYGIYYSCDALSSVTIDVGDLEDDNRYVNDLSVTSATSGYSCLVDGFGYQVDETTASTSDRQIIVTTAGAAMTGTLKIGVVYSID